MDSLSSQPKWLVAACCAAPMFALVYSTVAGGGSLDSVKYTALAGLCTQVIYLLVTKNQVKPPESKLES